MPNPSRTSSRAFVPTPEARLADLILWIGSVPDVRSKILAFMHFAEDVSRITVDVDASYENGLRLMLTYPVERE